jgi:hypothetical protein
MNEAVSAERASGGQAETRRRLDDDRDTEIARLLELGATRGADHDEYGHSWTVMADPEGNDFCVAEPTSS